LCLAMEHLGNSAIVQWCSASHGADWLPARKIAIQIIPSRCVLELAPVFCAQAALAWVMCRNEFAHAIAASLAAGFSAAVLWQPQKAKSNNTLRPVSRCFSRSTIEAREIGRGRRVCGYDVCDISHLKSMRLPPTVAVVIGNASA